MRKCTSLEMAAFALLLAGHAAAQVTSRVSVDSAGVQGNADVQFKNRCVSGDGRYVVFYGDASNLVPNDTNSAQDVFVRDLWLGITTLVSVDSAGVQGNYHSYWPTISADGRFVAFESRATNLVPGDTNGAYDIFVHDLQTGATTRASVDSSGAQANGNSYGFGCSLSADGRYVAFGSDATNLVPGDTNGIKDFFVRDLVAGTTERVSVDSAGVEANATTIEAELSADGRYVVYFSAASNLVPGDTNGVADVFLRDRAIGSTTRLSVDPAGVEGNGISRSPSMSADGRYVAYCSWATNLVPGDANSAADVFVLDRQSGTTTIASLDSSGVEGDSYSYYPSISADGRWVAFYSNATNLVPGDTNALPDVFVHDRHSGSTSRVSVDSGGAEGNGFSGWPVISGDGSIVAFMSDASNLVAGDSNAFRDVFVHERAASHFTSLCDPGVGGVSACPCANPPSGSGRGCDNSSATGGAVLTAGGVAYLALDSLVFTTSGEKPAATSILLQGDAAVPAGVAFGQGVRCAGGALKRLFVKTAVGGSVTAPDFGAGDPTISARSAALGDAIQAGQSRWYLVYYRDPTVLGGCPGSSTFNATQTGVVGWWP